MTTHAALFSKKPHGEAHRGSGQPRDHAAFSILMEPFRRELVAYCYRLTGSLSEAEDLAQEAFVRAFRGYGGFEGRATPRAWLYRIAHNLCMNHVQRKPPSWESFENLERSNAPMATADTMLVGEQREDLRLGFVALVRSLPPRQRAALVLRDVLGWSAEETARILETTVPAVKNALARARKTLARHPNGGDPADVCDLAAADAGAQAMIAEWVDAFEKGNTARMVALLTSGDFAPELKRKEYRTGYNAFGTKSEIQEERQRRARAGGQRPTIGREQEEITDGERSRT